MQNLFLTLIILIFTIQPVTTDDFEPIAVLELFTSQGCSSCPSADELLKSTNKQEHVIALSYHVDYWNYIGWKDPFSKKSFSDKQRRYSHKFNSSTIYTPQVVVNGKEHFVGSNKSIMQNRLKTYLQLPAKNKVVLNNIERKNRTVNFDYELQGPILNKRLRAVLVINERTTSVKSGENRNRILKNNNIVVEEIYLNLENIKGNSSISIPKIVNDNDALSLIAIVENTNLDIMGAYQIKL
jgi:hypothetical protein